MRCRCRWGGVCQCVFCAGSQRAGFAYFPSRGRRRAVAKVLVAYYSRGGNTRRMAELVAEGARKAGADVELATVDKIMPEDLLDYDGIIIGSPTYYGQMCAEIKKLFDDSVRFHGKLEGKVGGAFSSAAATRRPFSASSKPCSSTEWSCRGAPRGTITGLWPFAGRTSAPPSSAGNWASAWPSSAPGFTDRPAGRQRSACSCALRISSTPAPRAFFR